MATYNEPTRKWASKPRPKTPVATISPSIRDLEWAAGFLEGEGCFIRAKSSKRGCEMVAASQKEVEPLTRLQTMFGGGLCTRPSTIGRIHMWQVYGSRARGIMMTLFSLMSTRRKGQIKLALIEGIG